MQPANINTAKIIGAGRIAQAVAQVHLRIFLGCSRAACGRCPAPQGQ